MAEISILQAHAQFTQKVVAVYNQIPKSTAFLRSFFKVKETNTKEVSIMVKRGTEYVAVDVERGTNGNRNRFSKSSQKVYIPPFFNEHFDLTEMKFYDVFANATGTVDAATFKEMSEQKDILIVDTRSKETYTVEGTVPGAWYIGLDGTFAPWVGALINDINQKIIFIAEDETRVNEIAIRFSRVGYDNTLGYLFGGIKNWIDHGFEVDKIETMSGHEFTERLAAGTMEKPLDVRKESEYLSEHVVGVESFPLDFINSNFAEIDPDKSYFLHCATGYRSLVAASIFQANGVKNVTDVRNGFIDIKESKAPLTDYVCPTTLL